VAKLIKLATFFLILSSLAPGMAQAFSQDYLPTDPNIIYQTYFDQINGKSSWSDDVKVNKGVVVAVLDSGVDIDHPDLYDNIWVNTGEIAGDGLDNDRNSYIDDVNGWDFLTSTNNPKPDLSSGYDFTAINHGTVVAGIIAAAANEIGVIGIAPKVKVMPLKILDAKGSGNTLVLAQAINYAVENGADIINLSLVGKSEDEVLRQAITDAYNQGVMIVAASGNEDNTGIDMDISPRYPVCDFDSTNRVIGVAAVDQNNKLTIFSNYGQDCIDISAPGTNVYSTVFHDLADLNFAAYYQGGWSGTSVAAPMVTATLALMKMNFPDWRPADFYRALLDSTDNLQAANPNNYKDLGRGLLDVGAALNLAAKYYNQSIKLVLAPQAGQIPEVLIMDDKGGLQRSFLAYNKNFLGGVNVATGDVNQDGQAEIVTAPISKGGPHVRIFNNFGQLLSEFFAYPNTWQNGLNIGVGDINSDGRDEIITAPASGLGSEIKVFDDSGLLLARFDAYGEKFRGGVNLSVSDVNGDNRDEIITTPASSGGPHVRIFNYSGQVLAQFFAYTNKTNRGVQVTAGDIDNDGWAEIITVPARGEAPMINVFDYTGNLESSFIGFSKYLTTGLRLLAKDISGDQMPEILAIPSKGAAALLRVYDVAGLEKSNLYLRSPQDRSGYNFDVLVN